MGRIFKFTFFLMSLTSKKLTSNNDTLNVFGILSSFFCMICIYLTLKYLQGEKFFYDIGEENTSQFWWFYNQIIYLILNPIDSIISLFNKNNIFIYSMIFTAPRLAGGWSLFFAFGGGSEWFKRWFFHFVMSSLLFYYLFSLNFVESIL